jgi:hypothetical protein
MYAYILYTWRERGNMDVIAGLSEETRGRQERKMA